MAQSWQQALEAVRARSGGPGSTAWLAAVGKWMSEAGFHPSGLPVNLSRFLAELPGFCTVDGDRVRFLAGPVSDAPAPEVSPHASGPDLLVAQPLWKAMLDAEEGVSWYLDLETDDLVRVAAGEPEPPEMERMLRVPTLSEEDQRRRARELLGSGLDVPEGPGWFDELRETLDPDARARLERARRSWLVQLARDWVRSHGLREDRFIYPRRRRTSAPKSDTDLRQLLRRALDASTEEELRAWAVPASVLQRMVQETRRETKPRKVTKRSGAA